MRMNARNSEFHINGVNEIEIIEGDLMDLKNVYNLLKDDFAPEELKEYTHLEKLMMGKKYQLLLAKHKGFNEIIGYAFIYIIDEIKAIWLDYFVIVKGFRNSGYGTLLFTKIAEAYRESISGIFVEVEIPEELEGHIRDNQRRRISFYERLGAKKLDIHYELPTDKGGFPMHLYYKHMPNRTCLDEKYIHEAISSTFVFIHSDVKNREDILIKCMASIN